MSLVNGEEKVRDFASCFTFDNLMLASKRCLAGSSWKYKVQLYDSRRITECKRLFDELHDGSYRLHDAKQFTVNERGKLRNVKSIAFRDRVVQRCLCDYVFSEAILNNVIEDTSAALKTRGTTYAYERVKFHTREAARNSYIVQYDFTNYFGSINQQFLLSFLDGVVDKSFAKLLETIICSNEVGLELGSAVNQLCATFYPTPLDLSIQQIRGVTGYHRYMDDGIVFCETIKTARAVVDELQSCSECLQLHLKESKTFINKLTSPFVFCKVRFTKLPNGGSKMNMRKRQTHRSVKHFRNVCSKAQNVAINVDAAAGSMYGYINRGDADLTHIFRHEYYRYNKLYC